MKILSIHDKEFKKYGQIVNCPYVKDLAKFAEKIELPEIGCKYIASVPEFETPEIKKFFYDYFGELDVQLGICYGYNKKLNALEWHKSSEVHVAVTDFILMLGDRRDTDEDGLFDTKNMQFFRISAGEAVELYNTTLHFCPGEADNKPFKNVVVLPKGTNTPLDYPITDKRLTHKNKWLICHPESKTHVEAGRVIGLKGENYEL